METHQVVLFCRAVGDFVTRFKCFDWKKCEAKKDWEDRVCEDRWTGPRFARSVEGQAAADFSDRFSKMHES